MRARDRDKEGERRRRTNMQKGRESARERSLSPLRSPSLSAWEGREREGKREGGREGERGGRGRGGGGVVPDRRPDLKLDTLHIFLWNGTIGVGRGWPVILPNPSHLNVPGNLVQLRHSQQPAARGQTVLQAGTEMERDIGEDRLT